MSPMRWLMLVLVLVALVACAGPAAPHPAPTSAPTTAAAPAHPSPPLFELHSDPWVNLHQRLIAEATANQYWHGSVTTCACARTAEGAVLPAWSRAVATYKKELEGRSTLFDPSLVRTNLALALLGTSTTLAGTDVDPALASSLESTYEAYLRGAWPADDARNRAWIATVEPLVARWGPEIAADLAKRLGTSWPSYPIRVEVTQYAGFGGAYTTSDPILTTMSSEDAGYAAPAALEMLFHEASHGLDGNLDHDLQMAFIAKGKREPRSLDHMIIFYTAGELAQRRLGPGYVPYAVKQGVYARGKPSLEPALRAHWQPWLDDAIDRKTALARLADALP